MKKPTPAELRAEADRIEAEAIKTARLADAARIPTCPECGGRSFKVSAWTIVSQSIEYPEDPDEHTEANDNDWADDYESGDHTDTNQSADCNGCGADVRAVLEAHGWIFYNDPQPTTEGK